MAMEEHVSLDYMFFIRWLLMAMEEHVSLDYMFFILWLLMAMENMFLFTSCSLFFGC
jgi:hypothetical protein